MGRINFIISFIFSICFFCQVFAQTVSEENPVKIIYIHNHHKEGLPPPLREKLETINISELEQTLFRYFGTNEAQFLTIKKYLLNGVLYYKIESLSKLQISKLSISGISVSENLYFQKSLNNRISQFFSPEKISTDKKSIVSRLKNIGYPTAKILSYEYHLNTDGFYSIKIEVAKNQPCHLSEIVVDRSLLDLFNFIAFPIQIGSLCNISSIKAQLDEIQTSYVAQGYLNSTVEMQELLYSKDFQSAKLKLNIKKGVKTVVTLRDVDAGEDDKQIFSGTDGKTVSDFASLTPDQMRYMVTQFYKDHGYSFVEVENPKIIEKSDERDIRINLMPGPKTLINRVNFSVGAEKWQEDIEEKLGIDRYTPFSSERLKNYKKAVESFLSEQGYYEAKVISIDSIYSDSRDKVDLFFRVDLGPVHRVGNVSFQNIPQFESTVSNWKKMILPGDIFDSQSVQKVVDSIKANLVYNGYIFSDVKLDFKTKFQAAGRVLVFLTFTAIPGPQAHIKHIFFIGDVYGKEKTLLSLSGLKVHSTLSQKRLDRARVRFLRNDFIKNVAIETVNIKSEDSQYLSLDLIVLLSAKTGFDLEFAPGYGSLKGYRFNSSLVVNQLNYDGLTLTLTGGVSQEKQQVFSSSGNKEQFLGKNFSVDLHEPLFRIWKLYTPLDVGVNFAYSVVSEPLTNKEYTSYRFYLGWKPNFWDVNWETGLSVLHEKSKAISSSLQVVSAIDNPDTESSELSAFVSFDSRNNYAWPTRGMHSILGGDFATEFFASQMQYQKLNFEYNQFFSLAPRWSLALYFGASVILDSNQDGDPRLPPSSRRLYFQDDAKLRGFPDGGVAPGPILWIGNDKGTSSQPVDCPNQIFSVGSTNLYYLKFENRFRFSEFLGGLLFVDSGASYLPSRLVDVINNKIDNNIIKTDVSTDSSNCKNTSAAFYQASSSVSSNPVLDYINHAYVSTGVGLRVILGNYASIGLDYGIPIVDPSDRAQCLSVDSAKSYEYPRYDPSNPTGPSHPACIKRVQDSNLLFSSLKFPGAIHLNIGAKF